MKEFKALKKLTSRRKMFEEYLRQIKTPADKQEASKKVVK
ncbi:MAG: hypothetical protein A4E55_02084 [Pelotomaculum sp. PtaU1.Bin035]|nr:MAG: hypothetical protein A4E55_02084 [Pelotomaculum sp. PtaU1.Bin035]